MLPMVVVMVPVVIVSVMLLTVSVVTVVVMMVVVLAVLLDMRMPRRNLALTMLLMVAAANACASTVSAVTLLDRRSRSSSQILPGPGFLVVTPTDVCRAYDMRCRFSLNGGDSSFGGAVDP